MRDPKNYKYSDLTEKIIKEVYYVFNKLGSGFLEKVYEKALIHRLNLIGLNAESQKPIHVRMDGVLVGEYYADIVIDDKIIIELKAKNLLAKIDEVQLVNYLKATKIEVGLLINFGEKIEIRRKVNTMDYNKE
ncbi:MAG: GxxExxY protein, partial [Candidatus Tenebribacter mawsonii]|nr:GxxExxY protein [Candidatus Tenebribacter mawsonii]